MGEDFSDFRATFGPDRATFPIFARLLARLARLFRFSRDFRPGSRDFSDFRATFSPARATFSIFARLLARLARLFRFSRDFRPGSRDFSDFRATFGPARATFGYPNVAVTSQFIDIVQQCFIL
ncbi:hypothetical protein [Lentibacillus juripiscarius]|uniref:Uncharacterized protein n=1 Tax=Lentibacillus juripiscarius TaxID=257446 RepID=A0ABW5V9Z8_9BACI